MSHTTLSATGRTHNSHSDIAGLHLLEFFCTNNNFYEYYFLWIFFYQKFSFYQMSKNDNFKQKIRWKIFRRKKFIEMIIRTNNIRRTVTDLLLQKGLANPVLFPLKKTHKSNHRNNTKIRLNTSQLIVSLFLVAY